LTESKRRVVEGLLSNTGTSTTSEEGVELPMAFGTRVVREVTMFITIQSNCGETHVIWCDNVSSVLGILGVVVLRSVIPPSFTESPKTAIEGSCAVG